MEIGCPIRERKIAKLGENLCSTHDFDLKIGDFYMHLLPKRPFLRGDSDSRTGLKRLLRAFIALLGSAIEHGSHPSARPVGGRILCAEPRAAWLRSTLGLKCRAAPAAQIDQPLKICPIRRKMVNERTKSRLSPATSRARSDAETLRFPGAVAGFQRDLELLEFC